MTNLLSSNTQVILLLTAPLIVKRGTSSSDLLKPTEYIRVARFLHDQKSEPADLLTPDSEELVKGLRPIVDSERLQRLLNRGFQLSQATERWQTRAIWVLSRADPEYPKRLKARLKNDAPPAIYGCGDDAILGTGGLAVVGSRNLDDSLVKYTQDVGQLTARAGRSLVSGAARGVDQVAMRGALEAGGKVMGVLADSLERTAMNREYREILIEKQLVLMSPYDPSAGFNVGHAMRRNKLIYALSDAALVVTSDYQKGGTWTGAVEQLEKHRLVPVYVRSGTEMGKGLEALNRKGALLWPNPTTTEELVQALNVPAKIWNEQPVQERLPLMTASHPAAPNYEVGSEESYTVRQGLASDADSIPTPADELFATVRSLLQRMAEPKTDSEVASELNVSRSQAKDWLQRLVKDGVLEKLSRPVRYRSVSSQYSQAALLD